MERHLGHLEPGQTATITGFAKGDNGFRKKLLAMGMTLGATLEVVRVAPLGDPIEVKVRGSSLSLRRNEAAIVLVEINSL